MNVKNKCMKVCWLFLCCFSWSIITLAQNTDFPHGFTYKFIATDYVTLDPVYQSGFDNIQILNPDGYNYGLEVGYFHHLHPHVSVGGVFRVGSVDSYHLITLVDDTTCQPCNVRRDMELFAGIDVIGVYKFANGLILPEDFVVAPYIVVGIGGRYLSQRGGNFDLQVPVGIGLNIKMRPAFYLQIQMEYRKSLLAQGDGFEISAGIFWLMNFNKNNLKTIETDE